MKPLILLFVLILPALCTADTSVYCDDPEAAQEWTSLVKRNSHSDNWQKLHAMWLGLCQKVKDGSIGVNRAIEIFEEERQSAVYREKKRIIAPVSPWG